MRRTTFLALLTIAVFALSTTGQVAVQADTLHVSQTSVNNFSLLLMTNAGNRIRESYAFFIKQAVAPLGIDVQILAKPFGQFVGDLLHYSTGQPFDLAIIGFAGGGPTPSLMWKFHSTETSFGRSMYQLNNPKWQEFQKADTGITTAQVDKMLEAIDFQLDPILRKEALDAFSQLYMDKLLYDLPLTTVTGRTAIWKGFGDTNATNPNEGWNVDEGTWASSWMGAYWNNNPNARASQGAGAHTLQFRIASPSSPGMFDPYQVFDTSTGAQTTYSTMNLLTYDGNYAPHPGIASQWIISDVVEGNVTVPAGRQTFIIPHNTWYFPATYKINPDGSNTTIAAQAVTANDFKLVMDMFKNPLTNVNGKEQYNPVVDYNVTSTYATNDTFNVYIAPGLTTPDDYVTFGAITPLPSHLLGGVLHVDDAETKGLQSNGTTVKLGVSNFTENAFNPQDTIEWQYWASEAGNTLVGPMALNDFALSTDAYFDFKARSDFPFPNEWDAPVQYAGDTTAATTLYNSLNTTSWLNATSGTGDPTTAPVTNLEYFAPHLGGHTEARYFAFNATQAAPHQKPTEQMITTVVVKNIADTNAALIAFEAGQLDTFGSSSLGANTVKAHENNPNFVVKTTFPISGPQLLVFNLLNEHLQKRNVRYAIASVIDKNEMTKINDGFAVAQDSPVWRVYERFAPAALTDQGLSWYKPFPIPYDYATGRDLMRLEGYDALDSNNPQATPAQPPVEDVFSTLAGSLGSGYYVMFASFALLSVAVVQKKKKNLY